MSTKPAKPTAPRLTVKELAAWRLEQWHKQGGLCRLCRLPLPKTTCVADHDHRTGRLRGLLHRPCNSVLGSVENGAKRYGMPTHMLLAFASGLNQYLRKPFKPLTYPTHRTASEKAALYKKRATVRRKKAQQEACK